MKNSKDSLRDAEQVAADEILPEYDFSRSSANPYAGRYAGGSLAITLDPDVAQMFPSAEQANDALRALAGIIRRSKRSKPALRRRIA